MSYRVPALGETWRAKGLPTPVEVTVYIDNLIEDEAGEAVVEFTATTRVGKAQTESHRTAKLVRFVQNYELATAEPQQMGGAA